MIEPWRPLVIGQRLDQQPLRATEVDGLTVDPHLHLDLSDGVIDSD